MLSESAVGTAPDLAEQDEGWGMLRVVGSEVDGRTLTVRLEGDLDIYSTREFSNHLLQAEARATDILIDLSRLKFIDCAGVHQLVEARQRAACRGGRLRLVKGPQRVHRVFALTGLESAFEFVTPEKS
ncbi:MAG TPA: STAS domain-containing protein [Actinomycetota bacterium]|nr:STAS domain-containing protein [Actinomycetota bacterium]